MIKTKISASIAADSINKQGDRITSFLLTFPRIILAEFNTHRVFSRNSSSSRAIPFKKMVEAVKKDPFIPIAFQKDHSGMQGTEYFSNEKKFNLVELQNIMFKNLMKIYNTEDGDDLQVINTFEEVMGEFGDLFGTYTLPEFWLMIRDKVVNCAILLSMLGVTKQICNRLLEPFMWQTVLMTTTELENFFELRCPQYEVWTGEKNKIFRSREQSSKYVSKESFEKATQLDFLLSNKGKAEIHIMELAEQMWDAYNESKPKLLTSGEWHIPFIDKIDWIHLQETEPHLNQQDRTDVAIKISTSMSARTSYTVVGEEKGITYKRLVEIHDELKVQKPIHASPFEHCAVAMEDERYEKNPLSRNFKGFVQYREIIENEKYGSGRS